MISSEVERISNCKVKLTVKIEESDLEPIRQEEIKKIRREVQIPGFRKGKAPLGLIMRQYKDMIEAYTVDSALNKYFPQAEEENGLTIVGTPELKKVDRDDDNNLVAAIEAETYPEVEIKKVNGLEVTRDKYVITDKAIEDTIDRLRREKAEVVTVEDAPAEEGMILVADMQELDEKGEEIEGKKYNDIEIRLGEGKFDPELEKQLVGVKTDEEREITKVYPDDFPQKDYAGKKEVFKVHIKKIQKEILPELTEEFIEELNLNVKTPEELRKLTREQMENQYKSESEKRFNDDITMLLLQENPFDVPDVLVDNYLDYVVKDVKSKNPQIKEDEIREYYRADALNALKWRYFSDQYAKDNDIKVDDSDMEKFYEELKDEKMVKLYKSDSRYEDAVKEDILNKKIYDSIVSELKVEENEIVID
jgi:trigger factor